VRSSLHPQKCPPGRSVRMLPKVEDIMVEDRVATGGATTTTPKVVVEAMREEGLDTMTREVEELVAEGERCKEAGEMEVVEEEVAIAKATIKMQEGIMWEEGEEVMEEETTEEEEEEEAAAAAPKAVTRIPAIMEEVGVTMTIITKTEAGIRREAGAVEVEGVGDEVEEDKAVAGEAEGGRISIKEDSLNSSSNMEGSTTTKLASIKADTTQVEDTV